MNISNNNPEESRAERLLQKWPFRLALIWSVWTVVAFFFATQVYMLYYREEKPVPFSRALFVEGLACFFWARNSYHFPGLFLLSLFSKPVATGREREISDLIGPSLRTVFPSGR